MSVDIDDFFDNIDPQQFNEYEIPWVDCLRDFYQQNGYLTKRQKTVIEDIYFRHFEEGEQRELIREFWQEFYDYELYHYFEEEIEEPDDLKEATFEFDEK